MGNELLSQPGGHLALDKKKDRTHHSRHHQQDIEVYGPGGVRQREIVHAQLSQQQEPPPAPPSATQGRYCCTASIKI